MWWSTCVSSSCSMWKSGFPTPTKLMYLPPWFQISRASPTGCTSPFRRKNCASSKPCARRAPTLSCSASGSETWQTIARPRPPSSCLLAQLAPRCRHRCAFFIKSGRSLAKCTFPRWPSSCPVLAVKSTVLFGRDAATALISSTQAAKEHPRSMAQPHQPERGVRTSTGARDGSEPSTCASRLIPSAAQSSSMHATTVALAPAAGPRSAARRRASAWTPLTCRTGTPRGSA
mmetsp:Transcript_88213/g.249952  ORF Transcript_88213/g.249952 Transcript_88213/m.249952 type:complete len:231 (-) Transcript_88213:285-977(-)